MNDFTMNVTVATTYDAAVARVRELLSVAVVSASGAGAVVEVFDPAVRAEFNPALAEVATEARERLSEMMRALAGDVEDPDAARP